MKNSTTTHYARQLVKLYPLISDQVSGEELTVILRELACTLGKNIPGDIVEFGCYMGTTSLFMRRVLDHYTASATRAFHVYDSFEGLPPKDQHDQNAAGVDFKSGELAVSKKQFLREFQKAKLVPPIAHKAWFNDLTAHDIPKEIAFAFLDGDFYDSILQSLRLVWPRMSKGGTLLIHDYKRQTLPGVERAIQDFFQAKTLRIQAESHIAIIKC